MLFTEAFHRGEAKFEEDLLANWPDDLPLDNQILHLGRIFGPSASGARVTQSIIVPPGDLVAKADVVRLDPQTRDAPPPPQE